MFESPDHSGLIKEEVIERADNERLLAQLSGFKKLSEEQKRFVRASLYIQQRAERGTDPVSASYIQDMPEGLGKHSGDTYIFFPEQSSSDYPYKESQDFIMAEYCHKVARTLESLAVSDPQEVSSEADLPGQEMESLDTYEDLEAMINLVAEEDGYPLLLNAKFVRGRYIRAAHTAIVLGKNDEGRLVVWEKTGYHMPFRLADLEEDFKSYKDAHSWRARPFRT